jgi:hypothetical protein
MGTEKKLEVIRAKIRVGNRDTSERADKSLIFITFERY